MANTYTQIYIHVVFAVQGRQNLILPEHNDELQKYMTGIITARRNKLIAINNMPDHFHILIGQKRWVHGRFEWQEGFGAFSYSHSQLGTVIRYIQNQQKHHRRRTFREEYLSLLDKFSVPHDERYLFKAIL